MLFQSNIFTFCQSKSHVRARSFVQSEVNLNSFSRVGPFPRIRGHLVHLKDGLLPVPEWPQMLVPGRRRAAWYRAFGISRATRAQIVANRSSPVRPTPKTRVFYDREMCDNNEIRRDITTTYEVAWHCAVRRRRETPALRTDQIVQRNNFIDKLVRRT